MHLISQAARIPSNVCLQLGLPFATMSYTGEAKEASGMGGFAGVDEGRISVSDQGPLTLAQSSQEFVCWGLFLLCGSRFISGKRSELEVLSCCKRFRQYSCIGVLLPKKNCMEVTVCTFNWSLFLP